MAQNGSYKSMLVQIRDMSSIAHITDYQRKTQKECTQNFKKHKMATLQMLRLNMTSVMLQMMQQFRRHGCDRGHATEVSENRLKGLASRLNKVLKKLPVQKGLSTAEFQFCW